MYAVVYFPTDKVCKIVNLNWIAKDAKKLVKNQFYMTFYASDLSREAIFDKHLYKKNVKVSDEIDGSIHKVILKEIFGEYILRLYYIAIFIIYF